jgi:hypothetical protein
MNSSRYLLWENFKSTVFVQGQQRVHRVTDSPFIELFGDGITNRVGILLEILPGAAIPPELSRLAFVSTRTFDQDGRVILEVSTANPSLQRHFYHFAVAVTERMLVEKKAATDAISLELHCFANLLEEKSSLGPEQRLGLLGELIFLEKLILKIGGGALDSWLGPLGEPHDFRFQDREFEVKTTLSPHRVHTINGPEQLVPSAACSLYIVSVLLGPAGASDGFSLADKVMGLSSQLSVFPGRVDRFSAVLKACGFRSEDSAEYSRRFAMRRQIGLVPVDSNFPAITRLTIQAALGKLAPRVESLQYDVSVEGLEQEDGTDEFEAVMPS